MPQFKRGKIPAIYNVVQAWHQHGGGVNYIAWAITAGPTATAFRQAVNAGGLGGTPPNHPDQLFWVTSNGVLIPGITNVINARGGVQHIQRIEIDCTLMPCNKGLTSCLVRVPQLIQKYGFNGIPLRIFSHRNEGPGVAGRSSKRMITTTSNAIDGALQAAYLAHTDWSWAPWDGRYP